MKKLTNLWKVFAMSIKTTNALSVAVFHHCFTKVSALNIKHIVAAAYLKLCINT